MIENIFAGVPIKFLNKERIGNQELIEYDDINPLIGILIDDNFVTLKGHKIFKYIPNLLAGEVDSRDLDELEENEIYIIELLDIEWQNMLDSDKTDTIRAALETFKWYNNRKEDKIIKFKPKKR